MSGLPPRRRSQWEFFAPYRDGEYGNNYYSKFSIAQLIYNDAIVNIAAPYFAMLPQSDFEQLTEQKVITNVIDGMLSARSFENNFSHHYDQYSHLFYSPSKMGITDISVSGIPDNGLFSSVKIVLGEKKVLGSNFIAYLQGVNTAFVDRVFGIHGIIKY